MERFDFVLLLPLILGLASFVMITIIVIVAANAKQRRAELQAEVQSKLIDRFGSAPELLTFLKSPEGRKFLGEMEKTPKLNARDRIIRGLGKSLVVTLVGLGFLVIGFIPATYNEFCIIVGFLLLFLGIGFCLSSLLSLRLSRSWGLIDAQEPPQTSA